MALPRIVVRGKEIILLSGFKDEAKETNNPSAAWSWTTRSSCNKPPSGILTQLPSAMWRANGSPLLKPPLRCCHVTSRERGPLVSDKEETMCDFSLELYRSRPARVGERYETRRFPSGTVGFIAPGDVSTAVCMAYDTHLRLEGISQVVQNACGVMADEDVTFTRLEIGQFHDGVRFANGAQVTLQRLGPGVKGSVIDALLSPLWAPEMAEVL